MHGLGSREHWENIYSTLPPSEVSWFQEHAELSVKLIRETGVSRRAPIIDVGGGASRLVDDLLADGYENVTVLDLSEQALTASKRRLGAEALRVRWLAEDILDTEPPAHCYDVWHDRAVFHFLTAEHDRARYVEKVLRAVEPGGFVIVATFAEDGPSRCSGLPVVRYTPTALHSEFGSAFSLISHVRESHRTPSGREQPFTYCLCRR